jgi:transposase-like protein
MTRGVAHSPELRAQAVAAVLAGTALTDVARRYGISKGTLGTWLAQDEDIRTVRTEQRDRIEHLSDRLIDLVHAHITTISAQLQIAAGPAWIEKQSAAELAELVAVERDTTLRLLAGLFPPEPDERLELNPAADTPPGTADHDRAE